MSDGIRGNFPGPKTYKPQYVLETENGTERTSNVTEEKIVDAVYDIEDNVSVYLEKCVPVVLVRHVEAYSIDYYKDGSIAVVRLLNSLEPGSMKCLQQIHAYLFGGLYEFAGQIRTKNISKGGFTFANCLHFSTIIPTIERMPETTLDEIADKYVEMNVEHPFMEGNGRSTRIWLDLMLRRSLKRCVDWSQIDKNEYLTAMRESVVDSTHISSLC